MDVQHQQEDYAKKKQEREQEIKAIQEMLSNIAKSSPQKTTNEEANKTETQLPKAAEDATKDLPAINTLQRSKTDILVRATPNEVPVKSATSRTSRMDTARSAVAAKPRSKSSNLPVTNSVPNRQAVANKKTYNPEEARRFMEMQKKKRKSELANQPQAKANKEKEEIKKRLEELKKNTRKLVSKNLDKKKHKSNSNEMPKDGSNTRKLSSDENKPAKEMLPKINAKRQGFGEMPAIKGLSLELKKPTSQDLLEERRRVTKIAKEDLVKPAANVLTTPASVRANSSSSLPLGENHKRIGLLRKTEDEKDYSFSALKGIATNGKENVILENLTSKLSAAQETKVHKERPERTHNKPPEIRDQQPEEEISDLEIPSKNLKSNSLQHNPSAVEGNCSHIKSQDVHKANDLPYLLRPSAAQIYPYNFIMAVRRKLEAISQPHMPVPSKRERTWKTSQCTSTTDLLLVGESNSSEKKDFKEIEKKRKLLEMPEEQESKKRKSFEAMTPKPLKDDIPKGQLDKNAERAKTTLSMSLESLKSPPLTYTMDMNAKATNIQTSGNSYKNSHPQSLDMEEKFKKSEQPVNPTIQSKYKSMESVASNYSSVSLPISNTLTEISSLRTESRHNYNQSQQSLEKQGQMNTEDEVTSISSHIFSSPEKKYAKQHNADFEFIKPRAVSPLSLEKIDNLKIKSKQNTGRSSSEKQKTDNTSLIDEDKEMHFSQLLEDFNRSLSQVILVNEQLKSTLDKSSRILSPRNSAKKPSSSAGDTDKAYSSDFENSKSPAQNDKLKQSLENTNEKLKTGKRQLFLIANKVKPLLTPPKSSIDENDHNEEIALPKLDLGIDLKMLTTNSSARTTTSLQTADSAIYENKSEVDFQAGEEHEKRLDMIEHLKEDLRRTIRKSQEKRKNTQDQHKLLNKKTSFEEELASSSKTSRSNMSLYAVVEQHDGKETLKEIKPKSEISESSLEKKMISHDNRETLPKRNKASKLPVFSERNTRATEEIENSSQTASTTTNTGAQRDSEFNQSPSKQPNKTFNATQMFSESNKMQHSHSDKSIPTHSTTSQATKAMRSATPSIGSQSEIESLPATNSNRNKYNLASCKATIKQDFQEAGSSSISEELQKTFETASHDNENLPLKKGHLHTTRDGSTAAQLRNTSAFIRAHINRSRGDFQEINTKEATLNETQFQLAIISSQAPSSSELAQSADDEVTSSVKSIIKRHKSNYSSNPPSYNAVTGKTHQEKQASSTTFNSLSPSKAAGRISIGAEIVKFFHEYDNDKSLQLQCHDTMSESSLNYSNVGLYDKLIQNETNKSQQLTALLKMREKAILDRTKGQIAWLEVQKARYKAKGLLGNIAAIKKKQRGILIKMEKEREEIKRLLQSTSSSGKAAAATTSSAVVLNGSSVLHKSPLKHKKEKSSSIVPPAQLIPPQPTPTATGRPSRVTKQPIKLANKRAEQQQPSSSPIIRATYELESSTVLEELLKKREEDLRRRRQHVEHLMKWHQRLDEEEAEVLQLERQLLNYNNVPRPHMVVEAKQKPRQQQMPQLQPVEVYAADEEELTPLVLDIYDSNQTTGKTPEKKRASRARKMEKRLKDIDKSLKDLSHISATSASNSAIVMGQNSDDIDASSTAAASAQEVNSVRATGSKLNKLWKSLTSQTVEKYEPTRRYKLCTADLKRLYEEAKMAVLRDFTQEEERIAQELLEKSSTNLSSNEGSPPPATGSTPLPQSEENLINLPPLGQETVGGKVNLAVDIPALNLNFSSGHSEPEEEPAPNNCKMMLPPQGNYSPSVAEEHFKAQLLNSSASSSSSSSAEHPEPQPQMQQLRIENNVQMFLALTQRLQQSMPSNSRPPHQGLQRSLSDTQIAEIPKFSAATSHRNISANASQSNTSITGSGQQTLPNHRKSKSSIAEITNIPETVKPSPAEQNPTQRSQNDLLEESSTRPTVIAAVGNVSSITNVTSVAGNTSALMGQHRLSFSGQVGYDSEQKAREISSKLDEISAAVIQLSQANALPSYPAATASQSKCTVAETSRDAEASLNEEANLSTDASSSSYSLHFANISIDRHSSPGSQHTANTTHNRTKTPSISSPIKSPTATTSCSSTVPTNKHLASDSLENSNTGTFVISTNPDASSSSTSKTFVAESAATSASKTFVKDKTLEMVTTATPTSTTTTTTSPSNGLVVSESSNDKPNSEEYEPDFEPDSTDETHIEDISLPLYETTTETTVEGEGDISETSRGDESLPDRTFCTATSQISIKVPAKEQLQQQQLVTIKSMIAIATSPDKELLPPPPLPPPPPPPPQIFTSTISATKTTTHQSSVLVAASSAQNSTGNGNQLMPDIINELELRRHQLILDNEHLKQYEHVAVPYMYVREIPNKPPPPYVPPAHGSPMTTIFPSEERIKDITFRRTHELYCDFLKTDYCNEKGEKLPSVMEEQITNIYERIILDICREYLEEHNEIVRDGDPANFHSQLAFFNPPNRLRCIQDAIYKEVRQCLAMDKATGQSKRSQIYSVYGQRAKQDHIGKIIIQEMYDEDDRWCNFHREESEVIHLIVEEMITKNIRDIAKEVLVEEGGSLQQAEDDEEDDGVEIEEINDDSEIQENMENAREEEQQQRETATKNVRVTALAQETQKKDQPQQPNEIDTANSSTVSQEEISSQTEFKSNDSSSMIAMPLA
uniref:CAP-Gly domain-containing protein n=1 Tax=Stomoxys calcitrans TaxID=35570 RepID=A0A1I8P880_STOCA